MESGLVGIGKRIKRLEEASAIAACRKDFLEFQRIELRIIILIEEQWLKAGNWNEKRWIQSPIAPMTERNL
jgi:hypothetical protein